MAHHFKPHLAVSRRSARGWPESRRLWACALPGIAPSQKWDAQMYQFKHDGTPAAAPASTYRQQRFLGAHHCPAAARASPQRHQRASHHLSRQTPRCMTSAPAAPPHSRGTRSLCVPAPGTHCCGCAAHSTGAALFDTRRGHGGAPTRASSSASMRRSFSSTAPASTSGVKWRSTCCRAAAPLAAASCR